MMKKMPQPNVAPIPPAGSAQTVRSKPVNRSKARRFARERTLQALYQWDLTGDEASEVYRQIMTRQEMEQVDTVYFERLFKGVTRRLSEVDEALEPRLDRPLVELDPVERAVLRLAALELLDCRDTPVRVVINEAVEITKRFGADNGHTYVNGVLDRVAAALRADEPGR